MSEWDYLPTPYESLVKNEQLHSLLMIMSLGCMISCKVISPIDLFLVAQQNVEFKEILNRELEKKSLQDFLKTLLQFEDLRSQKKRERIKELIGEYVRRSRTKNI